MYVCVLGTSQFVNLNIEGKHGGLSTNRDKLP